VKIPATVKKKAAQVCVLTLHTPSTARARAATAQGKLRLVAAATRARLARTSRPSPVLASQHHSIELVCAAAPHTTNLGTSRTRNNILGPRTSSKDSLVQELFYKFDEASRARSFTSARRAPWTPTTAAG
jgi:hypothetical protein